MGRMENNNGVGGRGEEVVREKQHEWKKQHKQ